MKSRILLIIAFFLLTLSFVYADSAPVIKTFTGKKISEDIFQLSWEINDDQNLIKFELYKDTTLIKSSDLTGNHIVDIYQDVELHPENHTYILFAYDNANHTTNATLNFRADNKAPVIQEPNIIYSTEPKLIITTDENATCKYYDTEITNATLIVMEGKITHTSNLNITPGNYSYNIICFDENLNKADKNITFIYSKINLATFSNFDIKTEPSKVILSWNSTAGIAYKVYKSLYPDKDFSLIATTTNTTYIDNNNLKKDSVYYYYIQPNLSNSNRSEIKSALISSSNVKLAITTEKNPVLIKNEYLLRGSSEPNSTIYISVLNPYNEKMFTSFNFSAINGNFEAIVPIPADQVIIDVEVFDSYNNSNKERITAKMYQKPAVNVNQTQNKTNLNITKESNKTNYTTLVVSIILLIAFAIVVWQIQTFKRKKSDQFNLQPYLKKRHKQFRKKF